MSPAGMELRDVTGGADVEAVRALFVEYQDAIGIDLCFQGFAAELAGLPGAYVPPSGRLLLALVEGEPAGCIALRPTGDGRGEMKRLYVRPAFRGRGLARRLASEIVETARRAAYASLVLDTLPSMVEARALYRQLGFVDSVPFGCHPVPGTIFLSLDLSDR